MKRHLKILFSSTLILSSAVSFSQIQGTYLDINNVKARFEFNKPIFNHDQTSSHGFITQKNGQAHGIYSSGIWVGGKDVNGQLHLAGQMYGIGSDFTGAPSGTKDGLFLMTKQMVDDHIANWNSSGYVIPQEILDWPGNGDPLFNEPWGFAPYVNVGGTAAYEPAMGDYPEIKGDMALFWFLHDDTTHTETGGARMKIDVRAMAYAYDCPLDSALNNAVFVDYQIANRSTSLYNDVWFGSFTDFDIGCSGDDYVRCDVERGVFYAYNGDHIDDASCNGSVPHQSSLPAVGCMLFGSLQTNDGQDNIGPNAANNYTVPYATAIADNGVCYKGLGHHYGDGIVDNERVNLRKFGVFDRLGVSWANDPTAPGDYYSYLTGNWLDGTPWLYGGYGHHSDPNATAFTTDFMFPNDSDPQYWSTDGNSVSPWTEETESNLQGDRRALGCTGPFRLTPGGVIDVTSVFIAAHDYTSTDNLAGIPILLDRAEAISNYIESGSIPTCGSTIGIDEEFDFGLNIYPNPGNGVISLDSKQTFNSVKVYNLVGELVYSDNHQNTHSEINIEDFANGIYVIKVSDNEGRSNQLRYVKQ